MRYKKLKDGINMISKQKQSVVVEKNCGEVEGQELKKI